MVSRAIANGCSRHSNEIRECALREAEHYALCEVRALSRCSKSYVPFQRARMQTRTHRKRGKILIVPKSSKRTALVTNLTGIGAVILAAGASTRIGMPKQLLQFRGQTFLRHAASVALEAGGQPVVVVAGANAAACRESLRALDVLEVENQQWESGISSSVRVGIEALVTPNPRIAAVVLMLCDCD